MARGQQVSQLTHRMHAWVIKLTEDGEFEDHQHCRTVFDFYCQHMAACDDPDGAFLAGEVLTGVIYPPVVARKTGLDVRTVRKANDWLHEQGFVWIEDEVGIYRKIKSVTIMTIDAASERSRKKMAGKVARAVPDRAPRKRRHLRVVARAAQN